MAISRKIFDAISAKDASIATGVLLAAMAWTVTRLADAVVAYDTLEYEVTQSSAVLANGSNGYEVKVQLTNLSGDTTLKKVRAQLIAHGKGAEFGTDSSDYGCAVEPPGWAGEPKCDPMGIGFDFSIDQITPGTFVGFQAKYSRKDGAGEPPVLRIELPENLSFRLIKSGIATGALHYQTGILAGMVLVLFALLVLSLIAGIRAPPAGKSKPEKKHGAD